MVGNISLNQIARQQPFRLRRTLRHAIWTTCQRPPESRTPCQALRTPSHWHSPPQSLRNHLTRRNPARLKQERAVIRLRRAGHS